MFKIKIHLRGQTNQQQKSKLPTETKKTKKSKRSLKKNKKNRNRSAQRQALNKKSTLKSQSLNLPLDDSNGNDKGKLIFDRQVETYHVTRGVLAIAVVVGLYMTNCHG